MSWIIKNSRTLMHHQQDTFLGDERAESNKMCLKSCADVLYRCNNFSKS